MRRDIRLLSLDTSTDVFSLAVSKGPEVLVYKNTKSKKVLSSLIVPNINRILKKANFTLFQLDGFAVGLGPGSFTSLRVGLSTVKGLAFATKKPVVGISSLDILAMNVEGDHPQICTVCDARRGMVYACLFRKKKLVLKRKTKPMLLKVQELLKKIKGEVLFIGDGLKLYKDEIQKEKRIVAQFAKDKFWYPQARQLVPLALERFQNKGIDDVVALTPEYLYPEDCQVR